MKDAVITQGTIVSVETAISMSSDSIDRVFHPVFTFKDANGAEHRVRSAAGTFPESHKIGDLVEVFYNPQAPAEAMIDPKGITLMSRICVLAGFLSATIATVFLTFGR